MSYPAEADSKLTPGRGHCQETPNPISPWTNCPEPAVLPASLSFSLPFSFPPNSASPSSMSHTGSGGPRRRNVFIAAPCFLVSRSPLILLLALLPALIFVSISGLLLHAYSSSIETPVDPEASHGLGVTPNRTRRLPHCLIIGVRKGGTRAVLKFLAVHPAVAVAGREAHFFDRDTRYRHGLAWYRTRMPLSHPDQFTVEKTPAYFHHPLVPSRIRQFSPRVKLIVVLRDPVERAVSDYTQVLTNRRKKGRKYFTFEELAFNNGHANFKCVQSSYRAIWRSLYNIHMQEWLRHFPLSSFHFVDGQRLVVDPAAELRRVENFLGIPNYIKPKHFYFNKSRGFYCLQHGGCLANSKGRKHPTLNTTTISALQKFFDPHVRQFYRLIGRDFGWLLS